jgi:TolB protein
VNRHPNHTSTALRLAALLLVGAFSLALAAAQTQNPAAQAAYDAGLAAKQAKDLPTALHQFEAAIKLDPDFADAYWGAAWCDVGLGRDAEAVEAFRWVIRLAPQTDNGVEAAKSIERIRLRHPSLGIPPPEPPTFMIAVALTHGGNTDLFLADAQGNLQRRLTTNPASDSQPAFSPDAYQIVFTSDRSGSRNLWTLKADGTGLRQLTDDKSDDYSPSWAPDGKSVAFVSNRDGAPGLYSVDVQTGLVTGLGQTSSQDLTPAWSPAGDALAFVSDRDGPQKLFLWDPTTHLARKLLANTIPEQRPVWSPDGKSLYFTWNLEGHWQICRVGSNGEGLGAVAPSPDDDHLWGVSPDGAWLLISSDRGGLTRLFLRATSGDETRPVAPAGGDFNSAAISPALPTAVAKILYTSLPPPRALPGPIP